jgi:GT2 family glycosyltransferase
VLLLNSDTIVHPGVLRTCFNVMERDPTIGVMSVMLKSPDGSVQNVARKFPTPLRAAVSSLGLPWLIPALFRWADIEDGGWDRATCARDVDWLGGAFLFIRATALRQIGPLDQTFFFYGEDIEFCHRMAKAGFRRRYDPTATVAHIGGASTRRNAQLLRRRARYQVQRKCYGETAACVVGTIDIIASWLRSLRPGRTSKE